VRHLGVEISVALALREPMPKQSQPLQGVYGIHRTLQREMNVKAFEKQHCLIHNKGTLLGGQLFDRVKKLIQSHGCLKKRPNDFMAGPKGMSRNWTCYHWCAPSCAALSPRINTLPHLCKNALQIGARIAVPTSSTLN